VVFKRIVWVCNLQITNFYGDCKGEVKEWKMELCLNVLEVLQLIKVDNFLKSQISPPLVGGD
jgi:hypothetical protein